MGVTWLADLPVGSVLAVLALIGGVWAAIAKAWPRARRLGHLIDDLAGEPPRPGVPARPGVMVRLEQLERRLATVETHSAQLVTNGGAHLADAIHRIEKNSRAVESDADRSAAEGEG